MWELIEKVINKQISGKSFGQPSILKPLSKFPKSKFEWFARLRKFMPTAPRFPTTTWSNILTYGKKYKYDAEGIKEKVTKNTFLLGGYL